jgi:predicted MFS family arabinose efflux permease
MFAGAGVAAVSGSGGNPGTNKLIAAFIEPGRLGLITGIKQTGPQVGSFLAGLLAPWGATAVGWRFTTAVMAVLFAVPALALSRIVPADRPRRHERGELPSLPIGIWWVAGFGGLIGFGVSATFLLPLFIEESLGQTPQVAGLAAALLGAVAIGGRLQWARFSGRRGSPAPGMVMLAFMAVGAAGLMLVSISSGVGWMWLGTVLLGLSASSWPAVAAIAVIAIAGARVAGRASGIVWFGFLAGLGLGPPLFGYTVDESGSYATMWWLALGSFALAATVAVTWMRVQRNARRT